jgi:hypothetical protein
VSKTFNNNFLKGLDYIKKFVQNIKKSFVIYTGNENFKIKDTDIINFKQIFEQIKNF